MAAVLDFIPPCFILCFVQVCCSSAVLAFTKAGSPLRWLTLIFHLLWSYITLQNAYTHTVPFSFLAYPIHFGISHASTFFAFAIAKRWEYRPVIDEDGKPKPGRSNSAWDRFRCCFAVLFFARAVNLGIPGVKEVKNVPLFAADGSVPSRTSLLLRYTLQCLVAYMVVDFFTSLPPPPNAAELFDKAKVPFLRNLLLPGHGPTPTIEDTIFRLVFTALFWLQAYCILLWTYLTLAIVTMSLGMYGPADWRPMYGPLSSAYTVRGAWGTFWHQQMRGHMSTNADWIVHDVLGLPKQKGNLFVRYLKIFMTFAISGIMHWAPVLMRPDQNPQKYIMQFFLVQPLGFVLEDAVQALAGPPKSARDKTMRKVVGYIWTFLFFAWSTPLWAFPVALAPAPDPILPFSIFKYAFSAA